MFPIVEKTKIYKNNDFIPIERSLPPKPDYYYDPNELLFTRRKLIRDGVLKTTIPPSEY